MNVNKVSLGDPSCLRRSSSVSVSHRSRTEEKTTAVFKDKTQPQKKTQSVPNSLKNSPQSSEQSSPNGTPPRIKKKGLQIVSPQPKAKSLKKKSQFNIKHDPTPKEKDKFLASLSHDCPSLVECYLKIYRFDESTLRVALSTCAESQYLEALQIIYQLERHNIKRDMHFLVAKELLPYYQENAAARSIFLQAFNSLDEMYKALITPLVVEKTDDLDLLSKLLGKISKKEQYHQLLLTALKTAVKREKFKMVVALFANHLFYPGEVDPLLVQNTNPFIAFQLAKYASKRGCEAALEQAHTAQARLLAEQIRRGMQKLSPVEEEVSISGNDVSVSANE